MPSKYTETETDIKINSKSSLIAILSIQKTKEQIENENWRYKRTNNTLLII